LWESLGALGHWSLFQLRLSNVYKIEVRSTEVLLKNGKELQRKAFGD
jgi:hypothetical protein